MMMTQISSHNHLSSKGNILSYFISVHSRPRFWKLILIASPLTIAWISSFVWPEYTWFNGIGEGCSATDHEITCQFRQNMVGLSTAVCLMYCATIIAIYCHFRISKVLSYATALVLLFLTGLSVYSKSVLTIMSTAIIPSLAGLWLVYQGIAIICIAHGAQKMILTYGGLMTSNTVEIRTLAQRISTRACAAVTFVVNLALLFLTYRVASEFDLTSSSLILLLRNCLFVVSVVLTVLSVLPQFSKGLLSVNTVLVYQLVLLVQILSYTANTKHAYIVSLANIVQCFFFVAVVGFTVTTRLNPLVGVYSEFHRMWVNRRYNNRTNRSSNNSYSSSGSGSAIGERWRYLQRWVRGGAKDGSDADEEVEEGSEMTAVNGDGGDSGGNSNNNNKHQHHQYGKTKSASHLSSGGNKGSTCDHTQYNIVNSSNGGEDKIEDEDDEEEECFSPVHTQHEAADDTSALLDTRPHYHSTADIESGPLGGGGTHHASNHNSNNTTSSNSSDGGDCGKRTWWSGMLAENSSAFTLCLLLIVCYIAMLLTGWGPIDGSAWPILASAASPANVNHRNMVASMHIVALFSMWLFYALSLNSSYTFYHQHQSALLVLYKRGLTIHDSGSRRNAALGWYDNPYRIQYARADSDSGKGVGESRMSVLEGAMTV